MLIVITIRKSVLIIYYKVTLKYVSILIYSNIKQEVNRSEVSIVFKWNGGAIVLVECQGIQSKAKSQPTPKSCSRS